MAFWQSPKLQRVQQRAAAVPSWTIPDPFPASEIPQPAIPQFPPSAPLGSQLLARPPVIDRFPFVIGQNLTSAYLTSAYRLATSGWRYQMVDLLNELLEHDGHARAVTRQRVLSVAGGRIEVLPADLRKDHPDIDVAKRYADEFAEEFAGIPNRTQAISQLNWGVIYGVSALEIDWEYSASQWSIRNLASVHTRRLNYPNPTTWDLHIYDQGLVGPGFSMGETTGVYGLRIADFPGKFVVHTPALNADYPTRDGEGRYIGILMLLKRSVLRASAQDFERTIRPWVLGYFNRDAEQTPGGQKPRSVATPEDIVVLERALDALGSGAMSRAALPDSVQVELLRAASAMSATEFLSFLNREMSKAMLGQAFTTEPGANGNLSTSQTAKEGTMEIMRYDGRCLGDTLERDLAWPWLQLRHPEAKRRLLPRVVVHVDETPDPDKIMAIAVRGAAMDLPIDADKLAEQTGLELVPALDPMVPRRVRMLQAGKPPEPVGKENSAADPNPTEPEVNDKGEPAEANKAPAKPASKPNGKADAAPH